MIVAVIHYRSLKYFFQVSVIFENKTERLSEIYQRQPEYFEISANLLIKKGVGLVFF